MYDISTDGDIRVGLAWAVALSLPLWISIFGWVKIIGLYI